MRWEGVPVKFKKFRDRNVQGGWRIESYSLMPIWLRDLWPTHDFDPCAIWEKTKEKDAQVLKASDAAEQAAAAGKKKSGAKKVAKPSKKDQIQEDNARKLYEELETKDMEKLKNAGGKSQRMMLQSLKLSTPYGRLCQLLEILTDAVDGQDRKTCFDAFWAIESFPLYQEAVEEEAKIKEDEKEDDKDGSKDKKKKDKDKDKKKGDKDKKKTVRRSRGCQLVYDFKKVIKKAKKMRETEDLVVFQLTEMADRLPPLSKFNTGWKLDEWQKRVLRVVDERRSAIVCAPTSSGKTVISSYVTFVAGIQGRVLFVVPTEPLVWQVAALFHKLLKGNVGLCMDQMHFRPDVNLRVIVGTPRPLETVLSKLRGPVGEEAMGKLDYAQMQGGFTFDYAVYDEVHALDGEEGDALQRLIKCVNCNFLALSATIGNASKLQEWWGTVRDEQKQDVEYIEANGGFPVPTPMKNQNFEKIFLEEHRGRFINLQRMVWIKSGFKQLHPLSAVTPTMLKMEGGCFKNVSLPFTPRDTYELWKAFVEFYPEEKVKDLAPHPFFAQYKDSNRITLQMAKDYEDALCQRLEALAKEMPNETDALLSRFHPKEVGPDTDIYSAVKDIRAKDLCPAIMFHLDSYMCLQLFKELLQSLEVGQRTRYPNYIKELQERAEEVAKLRAQAAKKRVQNAKEEEEEAREMADLDNTNVFVDTAAPHPEFMLSPPNARLSSKEYDDIVAELGSAVGKGELKNPGHPFLRALRRGFGIYIDDASFPKYRRIVQRLAQQGKLAFVFSDESLAYGVNMPFRTCCFCASMEPILTPLHAQQMSGRAGRRGLDTQGNLLYMNMTWPRIQHLMLGSIPAIEGKNPLYPTVYLQHLLSEIAPSEPHPPPGHVRGVNVFSEYVDERMINRVAGQTLQQYIAKEQPSPPYLETSKMILQKLGYVDEYGVLKASRTLCVAMWELRDHLPESLAIASIADLFLKFFVEGKHIDQAESLPTQIEFCGLLLFLIDREPCPPGITPLQEHSFFSKAPERAARLTAFIDRLKEEQDKLTGLPEEDRMRLPIPIDEPIDGRIFSIVSVNSFQLLGNMDSMTRFQLDRRMRKLGAILMILHNVLMLEPPYDKLELLTRKAFARTKYIIGDQVVEASKLEDETEGSLAFSDLSLEDKSNSPPAPPGVEQAN